MVHYPTRISGKANCIIPCHIRIMTQYSLAQSSRLLRARSGSLPSKVHGHRRPHEGVRRVWRPTTMQSRPRIWSITGIGFQTVLVSAEGSPEEDLRLRTFASGTQWFHRQMISSNHSSKCSLQKMLIGRTSLMCCIMSKMPSTSTCTARSHLNQKRSTSHHSTR